MYLEYEFEWFVETLVILILLFKKKENDRSEHFLKYLFIKDLISRQQKIKKW